MALELPFIPIGPNPNGPATGRGGIPSSAKLGRLVKGPFGALACLRGDDWFEFADEEGWELGTDPDDDDRLDPFAELLTGVEDEDEPPRDEEEDDDDATGEGFR